MLMGSSPRIVRYRSLAAGLAVAALLAWIGAGTSAAQQYRPAPLFEGKSIPEPPEQGKPWTPPESRLPKFLVTATEALFQQGAADPRGCEYREIEIADGQIAKIHAFVIPERADVPGRFAVGWNGQVYAVLTVGGPADVDRDVRELAEAFKKQESASRNKVRFHGTGSFFTVMDADSDVFTGPAGVHSPGPIKLCVLLRLGRADLAETLFAAGTTWTPEPRARDLTDYGISYQTLADDWASVAFVRLVSAHRRGDDAIALDAARKLARFRDLATARMDEMGFPREPRQGGFSPMNAGPRYGPPPRFPFLGQLDALLADHERRAAMPSRTPVPPKGGDPESRVAALIRDLDQIDEQQMMSPGSASPGHSPLVRTLIAEGDPAVEPLLKALVSDDRLTRSISHGRSFTAVDSYVHPVVEAVVSALIGILKTNEFDDRKYYGWITPTPAARKSLADAMRQYWDRNRAVPLAERWYKLLLDDAAGPARWLEAAGGIVSPDSPTGAYVKPGTAPRRGEPLRDGRTPSVTELMLRRAREIAPMDGRLGMPRQQGLPGACTLASALAIWDERASLPLLQELSRQCREAMGRNSNSRSDPSLLAGVADFTTIRTRLGDGAALDEYADWLRTTTPRLLEHNTDVALKPLVDNPNHPALARTAQWLFTDPASPWIPILPEGRGERSTGPRGIGASALLVVPAFREGLIKGLEDRTPLETISRTGDGGVFRKMKDGSITTTPDLLQEKEGIAPGVEQSVRYRDLLVVSVSKVAGAPRLDLLWPEERRDQAAAACIEFLKRYGPHFEATNAVSPFDPGVRVEFPTLGRPATKEDVAAGRAIFALEGEVRTVKLPAFPQEARWLTLKDAPQVVHVGDGKYEIQYLEDGQVWQAEEVREGDRWVRYYGFVGHHSIGKAPASEIEFGPPYRQGTSLSGGLDAFLALDPPPTLFWFDEGAYRVEPGRPIQLIMWIRNHLGTDQRSPTEFLRTAPDGKPALRKGISLKISRWKLADPKTAMWQMMTPPEETSPSKHQAAFEPTDASRVVGPAESFEALRIDLNDWFDLSTPGLYAVTVVVTPESGLGEGTIPFPPIQVGGK